MTSQGSVQSGGDRQLRLESGTQALLTHDSLQSSVTLLPPSAYQNLLIVSPRSPASIERTLQEVGADLSKVGLLPLASTPHGYDGPLWTGPSIEPSDLTGLSMQYTRALHGLDADHGWVLFDDFNALLLYNDARRVIRLLDHLVQRTREADLRGVFTVVGDAMDDRTFASVRSIVDTDLDSP